MSNDPTQPPPVAEQPPAPPQEPPARAPSRWVGLFILFFLAAQLLLPLRYYLNAPTNDERFAWRMFSSVRLRDNAARLYETIEQDGNTLERPIPAGLLAPWQSALDSNRMDVTEKVMRRHCEQAGVLSVRYELSSKDVSGNPLPTQQWRLDRGGELRRIESAAP